MAPGPPQVRWIGPTARPPGESWEGWLAKLEAYKQRHGDCNVPAAWAGDPRLGQWVRRQRTRKKALDRGEPSERMTAARAAKLDALGFAWNAEEATKVATKGAPGAII
jgi:hypothetical protein